MSSEPSYGEFELLPRDRIERCESITNTALSRNLSSFPYLAYRFTFTSVNTSSDNQSQKKNIGSLLLFVQCLILDQRRLIINILSYEKILIQSLDLLLKVW